MSEDARGRAFDALATEMASGRLTRRKALKLLGAALAGGALASLGIGETAAAAGCKDIGRKCRKDRQCCSGICERGTCSACRLNNSSCNAGSECCSGICQGGICRECLLGRVICSASSECCSGICESGFCTG